MTANGRAKELKPKGIFQEEIVLFSWIIWKKCFFLPICGKSDAFKGLNMYRKLETKQLAEQPFTFPRKSDSIQIVNYERKAQLCLYCEFDF